MELKYVCWPRYVWAAFILAWVSGKSSAASLHVDLTEPPLHLEGAQGMHDQFTLRAEVELDGADVGVLRIWIDDVLHESIEVTEERAQFELSFGKNGELPHRWSGYEVLAQVVSETGNEETEITINPHDEEAPAGE